MSLSGYLTGLAGVAILAGATGYTGWLFWPVAPHAALIPWLVYMGGVLIAFGVGFVLEATVRPYAANLTFWRRVVVVLMTASNLGNAASVWVLLPTAGPELQMYAVLLCVWYLVVQLLTSRDANGVFESAVVLTLGSLGAFWLSHDVPLRTTLPAFLVIFGVTSLLLHRAILQTMREAITAQHTAQDAQGQVEAALSEVVAERDAKARFIAAASHDLQQPIQAARLYFEQLASGPAPPEALAGGREAFRAVQSLLEDMMEHLRLKAGAVLVQSEAVQLAPLFAELALQYGAAAEAAGIQIAVRPTASVAVADRRLLRRALGNLIDNAVKHSGGREIEVSAAPGPDHALEIRIRDDGQGISAANAARLFQEDFGYRRAGGASSPGFGLGLPSARRIANLLGGPLDLASPPEGGCLFRLVVPAAVEWQP